LSIDETYTVTQSHYAISYKEKKGLLCIITYAVVYPRAMMVSVSHATLAIITVHYIGRHNRITSPTLFVNYLIYSCTPSDGFLGLGIIYSLLLTD
jgi:hypothetical protein